MRKTKIVCTIGPASQERETLAQMVKAGMNVARMNFSHGDHAEHLERFNTVKEIREELDAPIAIMLDTKGPEIRTKEFEKGFVDLEIGQKVIITSRDVKGKDGLISVTHDNIANDVDVDDTILIDDGLVGLTVTARINDTDLECVVNNAGTVKNKKGVNIPNVDITLPALTQKDIDDIEFGIRQDIDFIAASFIRKASDVMEIRKVLENNNAEHIQIISKIENREGVNNIDEIIKVSDGIMVARGDLGVEIPAEEVPLVQRMLIEKCNIAGKPVITATQMLDSMMRNPRPTRAEVSDVATAIFEGSDAIMLSGETAAGKYPVRSVKTMSDIALKIEDSLDYDEMFKRRNYYADNTITNAISMATCRTVLSLDARVIITATASGYTAAEVSKFRPRASIVAATHSERVMRKLAMYWGVKPIKTEQLDMTDELIENSVQRALEVGYIRNGDLVVITAGVPVGVAGSTNLLKVHVVSELLYKKVGAGRETVVGRACVGVVPEDFENKFMEGDILVAPVTDKDLMPYIEKASAVIVEEGGLTSHAFIVCMNLGIEVVVGAENATSVIKDGETVTVNGTRGVVYRGEARIL
ncbi:pyruvate kinase [Dethiosulfatibacter aminovorans DSM 17477]|uniref:Pyruvate kinase n=1 Tax=Dethiosulfatibacter aminovorans DSM 17477 TaxID=1121476 RepID=A0A1M6FYZ8_9FIRM|nr:pyruvate kinase [Dethiosulfatibacter aminovorans]SHJ02844.1 pyruvate kinase [Dethiosulfatibacter aminovorans DSM 17477]